MKIKAILIDAKNGLVKQVEIEDTNFCSDCYKHIGCDMIEGAMDVGGNALYVDEEGLCKELDYAFIIQGGHQPFVGNGILVGYDAKKDKHMDCSLTVPEVYAMVQMARMDS